MDTILLVSVILLGLVIRLLYSLSNNTDEDVTLWLIHRQKDQKWVNYGVSDSIVKGYYGYPVFIHFLVSKIPHGKKIFWGRILNIFPDLITAVIIYYISTNFIADTIIKAEYYGIIASSLYLLNPILIPATSRMKTIKGRAFGALFVFGYFLSLFYFVNYFSVLGGITLMMCGLLVILTSQFAFQTLLIFSILLSLLHLSIVPLLVITVVIGLTFLMPFLRAKEPILFFFHHKFWYWRNYVNQSIVSSRNSSWKYLPLLPYYIFKKPFLVLNMIFSRSPVLVALFSVTELFILLFFIVYQDKSFLGYFNSYSFFASYAWMIVICSLITFILVCFKWLSFIGQAERYFEYSLPFLCLIWPLFLFHVFSIKLAYLVLFVILSLHITYIISNFINQKVGQLFTVTSFQDSYLNEMYTLLADKVEEGNIFTVPCKLGFRLSVLHRYSSNDNTLNFYYKFMKKEGEKGFKYYEEDTGGLNNKGQPSKEILRLSPGKLKRKYSSTHLLIVKSALDNLKKQWGHFYTREDIIYENNKYLLITIK